MNASPSPAATDARAAWLPPSERWPVAALMLASGLLALRAASVVPISQLMIDDGFYYLRIAHNLAWGLGSTWDGVHPTNGYHPLWLLILTPLMRVVPDPEAALTAVFGVEAVLLAIATGLLYLACRRAAGRWLSSLAAILWLGLTYRWFFSGMEYALQTVAILALIRVYPRWSIDRPLALGGLLAVAFLARIEILLLAGVIGAMRVATARRNPMPPTWLAKFLLPIGLAAFGYAGLNLAFFGHPLPVSGVVKGDWSRYLLHQDVLFQQHGWLAAKVANLLWPLRLRAGAWPVALTAGTLGIAVATAVSARWFRGRSLDRALSPLLPFTLFGILSFVAYGLVYHGLWSTSAWYFAVQPILAAMLLAALAEQTARKVVPPGWVAAVVGATIVLAGLRLLGGIGQAQPPAGDGIQPVLTQLGELPEDAVLASWNGGAMGVLSGRNIIALDGLANSWTYARGQRHDLCAYWRDTGVTHLVDAFHFAGGRPGGPVYPGDPGYSSFSDCADNLRIIWATGADDAAIRLAILELTK